MHEEDTTEEWRPVPGWDDLYEVSSHGRLRSLPRLVQRPAFTRVRFGRTEVVQASSYMTRGRIRALPPSESGHLQAHLHDGLRKRPGYIHTLVLEAFVGPCPDGMECCHNDGDPTNNHVSNLRWDTRGANIRDAYQHGAMPRGEGKRNAKLTPEAVREIRRRGSVGETHAAIAADLGVHPYTVGEILRGRAWRHVP